MDDHGWYEYDSQPDDSAKGGLDREYPYRAYYGPGGRRPNRRRVRIWVLVLLAAAVGAAVFFSRYTVELRQTSGGYSLSIREKGAEGGPAPLPPGTGQTQGESGPPETGPSGPPSGKTGTGTTLSVVSAPQQTETAAASGELPLQEIYRRVIPSVVSITTTVQGGSASGTGIIMSGDGYIITNDHVVEDAVAIQVLTSGSETYAAALVGSDETSDLAVLKIEAASLSPAEFGDSDQMEVGDAVVAIGDPLGKELRGTMTNGIISAINRDLLVDGRKMTLIQTNAALNNGNSGGPLINTYGQVIGINTMKMSSYYSSATIEGLGFAIPISTAKPIIDELIDKGYVSGRPAIGITGETLPRSAQVYYQLPAGVYVNSVEESSDAYAKGVTTGDIIVAVNGTKISSMEELNAVKSQYSAGDTIKLTIYRQGQTADVEITLMDQAGQ